MRNKTIEDKISSAYRDIAPDILDSVLADCDAQKGQIIPMPKDKKKTNVIRTISAVAAALLLVVGGLGFWRSSRAVASTVMLDVNPGIGISVNKNEKVLAVKAYNQDAEKVIGNMNFEGSHLDVAVNALIGSMLRNGYISDEANSILISVDSSDKAAGAAMQERLMNEVSGIMESGNVDGAVLGQTVRNDEALKSKAEQYGITVGKAELIDQITAQNSLYTFEELVPLTINELNLISESGRTKLENIESIGRASSSAYIGEESAKAKALERAGVKAEDASRVRIEMDWEKGRMVYEVDFDAVGYEYEIEVDAMTGDVVKYDVEPGKGARGQVTGAGFQVTGAGNQVTGAGEKKAESSEQRAVSSEQQAGSLELGAEQAKEAAYRHAGVNAADVLYCEWELDHKKGRQIYEIEFVAGGMEYDYDIDAETMDVLRYSREWDD